MIYIVLFSVYLRFHYEVKDNENWYDDDSYCCNNTEGPEGEQQYECY